MSFILKNSENNIVGGPDLSAFLFFKFKINDETKVLQVETNDCYFATYGSQTSSNRLIDLPAFAEEAKPANFTLHGTADMSIGLNQLCLEEIRAVEYSNEASQLCMFTFQSDIAQKPDTDDAPTRWVVDSGWSAHRPNRVKNQMSKWPFIKHLITTDKVKERDLLWTMSRQTDRGTRAVGVGLPFLKDSVLMSILTNHRKPVPKLELKVNERSWTAFDEERLPEGGVTGFAMLASGVFRQLTTSGSDIDSLASIGDGTDSAELLNQLSDVAERRWASKGNRNTPFWRNLMNLRDTNDTSAVTDDHDHPTEVIYWETDSSLSGSADPLINGK